MKKELENREYSHLELRRDKSGIEYTKQIGNATKECVSIMIAENATGEMDPVYIVYKPEKLWQSWI